MTLHKKQYIYSRVICKVLVRSKLFTHHETANFAFIKIDSSTLLVHCARVSYMSLKPKYTIDNYCWGV